MSKTAVKPIREMKSYQFDVKAVDDEQGLIEAYGSVFNVVDQGADSIQMGAFKRTIQNAKSRVQSGNMKFLVPMLFSHDVDKPIGGWTELAEDSHGLLCKGQIILTTQLGRETYELIKAKVVTGFSIGYDVLPGGAYYDKQSGVRNLTELRLWEISPTVFPMCEEAQLVDVKQMAIKSASGKTSWPLADRDTKWDAGQAKKDCEEWAGDDTGKLAQCCFWVAKSPPEKLGDCKLFFVAKDGGEMKAIPQGIISSAGVIQGAMGGADIDDVEGVKKKIATYYKKMKMTPPWENTDKSKGTSMKIKAKKDFNDHYRDEVIEDWLNTDFNNLTCALRAAILDMFSIGDEPQSDIETTVLNDGVGGPGFITALKAYVQKGIDLDVSNYLNEIQQQGTGYGSPYYLMSRGKPNQTKEGRAISATNQGHIQDHMNKLNDLADKGMNMMKEHTKAIRSAADDLATVLQGSEPLYAGPDKGTPDEGTQEGKATPSHHETRSTQPQHSSEKDTAMNEQELDAAIRLLKSLQGTSVHS